MRVVARRGVDLPGGGAQQNFTTGLQQAVKPERWALLAGGGVAQCVGVPLLHIGRLAGRDEGAHTGVTLLQRSVAAAVVAVQVGVEHQVQRLARQCAVDQGHGLCGVGAVAGVDQGRAAVAGVTAQQNVVGRQPAALQNRDAGGQGSWGDWGGRHAAYFVAAVGVRSSRRRILPTLVLGRSSRNSMCLGRL